MAPGSLSLRGDWTVRVSFPKKGNAYCCPPMYNLLPSPFQSLTSAPLEQHVVFTHRCHENTYQWCYRPSVMSSGSRAHMMRTIRNGQRKEKQAFRCTENERQSEKNKKINLVLFISLVLHDLLHKGFVLVLGAFMDEIMNMVAFYSYEQQVPW